MSRSRLTYFWLNLTFNINKVQLLQLEACSDARVLLASFMGNPVVNFYEIGLGVQQNSINYIKKDGQDTVSVTVNKETLGCYKPLYFWLGWQGEILYIFSKIKK